MTKILEDDHLRTAALGYIFHRIEAMMDGTPMMLFIDEGWKILKDDTFSAFLNDKLKTIRKLNGIVGFGTQSAKDIIQSLMGHTLLEQTPTKIFFPNPKADHLSYVEGFRLSEREFEWVLDKTRVPTIPHQTRSECVIARLDLSEMLDLVKVLSGNIDTVSECGGSAPRSATILGTGCQSSAVGRKNQEGCRMRRELSLTIAFCLAAESAFAAIPVTDSQRETQEKKISDCMQKARVYKQDTLKPSSKRSPQASELRDGRMDRFRRLARRM